MRDKLMMKPKFLLISILSFLLVLLPTINIMASPNEDHELKEEEILEGIEGIIHWKKTSTGIDTDAPLFNNEFLQHAGDTIGDWYPIGIGRAGYPDEYDSYLAVIRDVVEKRYQEPGLLSDSKATEWHRISLAVLAMGGDPTDLGEDENGESINLIADGTYNRGLVEPLDKQGINGWIWGLIALDSMRYIVPEDAYYTREEIIEEILINQLEDGGFSLSGKEADPDMTAMAIQALAPYYNSEETYQYTQRVTNDNVTKAVREVIDEALDTLSTLQLESGDYASWEAANVESTAQVIVALTSLGINPLEDERFIKNDNTLLDGLLKYSMADGGFIHSNTYDSDNPTASPDESNTMASEQALYSLVALERHLNGYRTLYDFREEMSEELKQEISDLMEMIDSIPENPKTSDRSLVEEAFETYLSIPIEERSYVFNYHKLADVMEELEMENTSEPIAENIGVTKEGKGTVISLFDGSTEQKDSSVFSEADTEAVASLPDEVTTEHYVEVVKLINRLENATNREEHEDILEDLHIKKEAIEEIEEEINSINQAIIEDLYPFAEIDIEDKEKVETIISRYEALSPYDQKRIQSYEDVEKAETQINSLIRSRYITVAVGAVVIILTAFLFIRRRKRKKEKLKQEIVPEE